MSWLPIVCRLSELRIIELLDDLSSELNSYVQVQIDDEPQWQPEGSTTGNLTEAGNLEKEHYRRQLKR